MLKCRPLFLLALLCITLPALAQETVTGEVVGVKDGDTIEVLHGRTPVTVRLHGVDTPETGQPFGMRAKQRASELVFGKVVHVEVIDTDRYGRTVGRPQRGAGALVGSEPDPAVGLAEGRTSTAAAAPGAGLRPALRPQRTRS